MISPNIRNMTNEEFINHFTTTNNDILKEALQRLEMLEDSYVERLEDFKSQVDRLILEVKLLKAQRSR